MSDQVYLPSERVISKSHCPSMQQYHSMYDLSVKDPTTFWLDIAKTFYWKVPPTRENFYNCQFDIRKGPISIEWMKGAVTNISYNLLDRNIHNGMGDKIAFFWEGNDPRDCNKITYNELHREVCQFANVLKSKGVKKGDRVAIYMPMIVELVVVMIACSRIGAVHSIVFGGYSADSLANRIIDGGAKIVVTADGVWRGSKLIHLLEIADIALKECKEGGLDVQTNIVVRHLPRLHSGGSEEEKQNYDAKMRLWWNEDRDVWYHEVMEGVSDKCEPEWVDAEDPLFMLYTSGSTGKPKGVLHTTAGYMLYTATTFKYSFDYQPGDIYWCTADIGWITGHSYVTYGPLNNGATSVLFEGTPFYPNNTRFWEIIEKYKVTQFYTAPTAIRALMAFGSECIKKHNLTSLRVLGSVGEPINPEAWLWYHKIIGNSQCSISDTYWQTETGGHVLTPLPGCTPAKPGSACHPFFGILPVILDEDGREIEGEVEGYLAFKRAWPGIMRTVYGDHERYEKTYFSKFPGYYASGDGARRDADGYLWVTGRIDDMLNCSGHLMSTAQIESVLVEHEEIAEAAVVSHPHEVKGECLYCYVTTVDGVEFTSKLCKELRMKIRERVAPFAMPDFIQHAPGLPKTRSGKIMRRILRKIAVDDSNLGDTSTLADESVINILIEKRKEMLAMANTK